MSGFTYLRLTTESRLLPIVTALPLGIQGVFALFVLCHFVESVLVALLGNAVRLSRLGNDNLPNPDADSIQEQASFAIIRQNPLE